MAMKSSFKKIIRRELEVAFSKKAQRPVFRILKYMVIGVVVYFFWDRDTLWWILGIALVLSLTVHFYTRYKTRGWTQSWGLWKYEKSKFDSEKESAG
jgi:hypothetical protein